MSRPRYYFRREHPSEQKALLRRLRGSGDPETPEDRKIVNDAIAELEQLLESRKRRRRLPSERTARKSQKSLFRKQSTSR
jgi:hypothetical protein